MPDTSTIAQLLVDIGCVLVDRAESVTVRVVETERGVNFVLSASSEDMGKLIGKQGRTARAIRLLLNQMPRVDKRAFSLDLQNIKTA